MTDTFIEIAKQKEASKVTISVINRLCAELTFAESAQFLSVLYAISSKEDQVNEKGKIEATQRTIAEHFWSAEKLDQEKELSPKNPAYKQRIKEMTGKLEATQNQTGVILCEVTKEKGKPTIYSLRMAKHIKAILEKVKDRRNNEDIKIAVLELIKSEPSLHVKAEAPAAKTITAEAKAKAPAANTVKAEAPAAKAKSAVTSSPVKEQTTEQKFADKKTQYDKQLSVYKASVQALIDEDTAQHNLYVIQIVQAELEEITRFFNKKLEILNEKFSDELKKKVNNELHGTIGLDGTPAIQ